MFCLYVLFTIALLVGNHWSNVSSVFACISFVPLTCFPGTYRVGESLKPN